MTLKDCVGHDPLKQKEMLFLQKDCGLLRKVMLKGWILSLVSSLKLALSQDGSLSSVKVDLKFLCLAAHVTYKSSGWERPHGWSLLWGAMWQGSAVPAGQS